MFSSITWEIFLTTVVVIVGGYYGITTLLLYHKEITHWVKSKGQQPLVRTASAESQEQPRSLMGSIQNEVTDERNSNITSTDETPEEIQTVKSLSNDNLLIGSVADLLQEIKTLVQLITECKSDKAECVSLFGTLLLRYPHLRGTTYQDAINLYIAESAMNQFSFDLTLPEIKTWWEEESTSKK